MVLGIRAPGGGRRHGLCSSTGVQPDLIQHETGHRVEPGPNHIPKRLETSAVPRDRAVSLDTKHEGHGGAGGDCTVPPPAPWRQVYR